MPKASKASGNLYRQLREATATLSRLQLSAQQVEQQWRLAARREQVLISGILLLQEVLAFYARQQHADAGAPGAAGAAAAADAACDTAAASSSGHAASYAARMLASLSRQHIEETLEWSSADWCSFVRDTYALMASQLELLEREPAPGEQPPAVRITKRELQQTIEAWYARMLVGLLFVQRAGPKCASVAVLNLMLNVEQAPPAPHWRTVVRRLRLSANQLAQLAAAYAEFQRLQAAVRAHALRLTSLLSSPNSCSLGVLLAVGGDSGDGSDGRGGSSSDSSTPGSRGGAPAPADLDQLLAQHAPSTQLPVMFVGLFLMDTLSPQQRARMVVASWPWVARPAPVAEAAAALWQEQQQQLDQSASGLWPTECADGLADVAGETRQELLEHVQQRCARLEAQHKRWWQEHQGEDQQPSLQQPQQKQQKQKQQRRQAQAQPNSPNAAARACGAEPQPQRAA